MNNDEAIQKECEEYWTRFISENEEYKDSKYLVWSFGYSKDVANDLIKKVIEGKKTGTSSSLGGYTVDEKIPEVGDVSIVTYGDGSPGCVIKTIEIRKKKFKEIVEEEAVLEGDGNLNNWRKIHEEVYGDECRRVGKNFSEEIIVIFERFILLHVNNFKKSSF